MADASYEVIAAIIGALKADSTVSDYVGTRVYDRPPDQFVPSPYISMGPTDVQRANVTCVYAREVYVQIDVWSSGGGTAFGSAEARNIAGAVEDSLHDKPLALSSNRLVSIEHHSTQVMIDADGVTHHAVIQFVAYVEAV